VGDGTRPARELARLWVHPAEAAAEPEVRAALAALGPAEWVAAESSAELRSALEHGDARALLLDVSLAGHGALDLLRDQRARGVTTPALVIAELGDGEAAARARELGGCAVLAREGLSAAVLGAALGELLPAPAVEAPAGPPRRSAVNAPAMLWKADARGELTHCTRRLLEYLGLDESQALGRGWIAAVHPDDHGEWLAAWADWQDSPREDTLDVRMRRADGAYRWLRVSAQPGFAPGGALDHFVGALADIDDLVAEREAARAEADRQEAANRELEELALAAAHDLQEPLRAVERELADALRSDPSDLALASRQVGRMRTLLRDLVDYTVATRIGVRPEPSDLAQALEWALENLRPALAESGAELKIETLSRVLADPIQIARVFQNLVANSLRFRSSSAPVIAVGASERERDALVFVRDNGLGIAEEHHEAVFRVFERAHPEVREGSGMGLAICRRIVERHGGRIWVESRPGEGSTFYFTLPRV
jgi:PAS domain S-box-containing protein